MRVLIAGGGVAALETVLALRTLGGPRMSLELLSPNTALLDRPGSVATAFGFGPSVPISLETIAHRERVVLRRGSLTEVQPDRHLAITSEGERLSYDTLVVATGAGARAALPGAITFRGPADVPALEALLERAAAGDLRDLVFAVPRGVSWSLPLYELAIMAAIELRNRVPGGVRISVVTAEREPLWLFGTAGAHALARMLAERGVRLRAGARAVSVHERRLLLTSGETLQADAVVALAVPVGQAIPGLPGDANGFLPVDAHGRVAGAPDVYAAGDATTFPIKQGGLATQQADAVAEAIAATAGALSRPVPFRPVLRGLLLTGGAPLYLRAELSFRGDVLRTTGVRATPRGEVSTRALWWPPGKVAGRYLAPYLATARPVALGQEPMEDRTPGATPGSAAEGEAFSLAVLIAEEDARLGDFDQALHALDAAAALHGGALPAGLADQRAAWALRAGRPDGSPQSGAAA
jgi:sulfide:quinone oxidoreductase